MFDNWRRGATGAPPKNVSEIAEEFLAYQRIYTEDPASSEFNLRIIKRHLGTRLLIDVSPREIEAMIAERLQAGIAKATINRQSATLSKMFNWSIERGYHPGPNPMRQIKKFRESPGRVRYLTADEASRFLLASAHHLKPIVLTALHTGGRLEELLTLTWGDVNFDLGIVSFKRATTKGRKERQVPLSPELSSGLRRLRPGAAQELVFTYNGRKIGSVRTSFLTAQKKAGLGTDVVFHTLRHTFASWFMMNGGDLYRLQKYLGHSSLAMTQRYSHLSPEFIRDGVRFIGPPRAIQRVKDEEVK